MEKKIEEIFDDLHHELITEKQAKELVIKAITTPSSLPTDEEIAKWADECPSLIDISARAYAIQGAKWLRTNFSSEKWISVKDKLPDIGRKVFILTNSVEYPDNSYTGIFYGNDTWHKSDSIFPSRNITHWMPLPNPPKQNG